MKTLLMFGSVMVFALSTLAVELTSSNVLGIQQVKQNKNDVVVPVTFAGVGTNGVAITLADTLYLDNLSMADTAMVMLNSSSGYYSQWVWLPGFMTGLYWTARRTDDTPIEAASQVLPRGAGIRVQVAKNSLPIYTLGQYTSKPRTLTFAAETTTLVANSSNVDMDLDAIFQGSEFTSWDNLIVRDASQELVYEYDEAGDPETGRFWFRRETVRTVVNGNIVTSSKKIFDLNKKKIAPGGNFRFYRGWFLSDVTVCW